MKAGVSQVDITPEPGIELCGFANRSQPSTEILDHLYCKGIYFKSKDQKILWLQLDVIGIDRDLALDFKESISKRFKIPAENVIIAATHTHSGPATIKLNFCGTISEDYLSALRKKILECCSLAINNAEECFVSYETAECDLGIDRRGYASAHTDEKVGIVLIKRKENTAKAVLINFAMHPVSLSGTGISADFPGRLCQIIQKKLPDQPVVFFALGACGNINPPGVGVPYEKMEAWSQQLAEISLKKLKKMLGSQQPGYDYVKCVSKTIKIELDTMSQPEINQYAEQFRADHKLRVEFGSNYDKAITKWSETMSEKVNQEMPVSSSIELSCMIIGGAYFVMVGAEIFSQFIQIIRDRTLKSVFAVSCANGIEGYIPTNVAYQEGGYEVETCFFFYNSFRPRQGTLEYLTIEAIDLINQL